MAIRYTFGGREIIEAGTYATIESAIPQNISPATSGIVLIIDTGAGQGWGSGGSVKGEFSTAHNAVYSFADFKSMQDFMGGGLFYDLAPLLFNPSKRAGGVQGVVFVRAATTTASRLTLNLAGATNFVLPILIEGSAGRAVIRNNKLIKGVAAVLKVSPVNSAKYVVQILRGGFKGVDNSNNQYEQWSPTGTYNTGDRVHCEGIVFTSLNGTNTGHDPIDDAVETNWKMETTGATYLGNISEPGASTPQILYTTKEFTKASQLAADLRTNPRAKKLIGAFSPVITTDAIVPADVTAKGTYVGAVGGTTAYGELAEALEYLDEEDYSFILATDGNVDATSTDNLALISHVRNVSEFRRNVFIPGAESNEDVADVSLLAAEQLDDELVTLVHGNCHLATGAGNYRVGSSLYLTALVLGRIAGLPPQVPGTWKDIDILGTDSKLKYAQRLTALEGGVLHLRNVGGEWVISQSINTRQENSQLINADASSGEISIERVKQQLVKEMVIESRSMRDANGNRVFIGGNKGTATAEDVKSFVEGYLQRRCVKQNTDNLIITFKNVVVKELEDGWDINFGFVANGPVNKMFFTGTMLQAVSN
jgi:hypothetical protein